MSEPIPYPVRPLVLPHDTHHYLATDRRAETDGLTLTEECMEVISYVEILVTQCSTCTDECLAIKWMTM